MADIKGGRKINVCHSLWESKFILFFEGYQHCYLHVCCEIIRHTFCFEDNNQCDRGSAIGFEKLLFVAIGLCVSKAQICGLTFTRRSCPLSCASILVFRKQRLRRSRGTCFVEVFEREQGWRCVILFAEVTFKIQCRQQEKVILDWIQPRCQFELNVSKVEVY